MQPISRQTSRVKVIWRSLRRMCLPVGLVMLAILNACSPFSIPASFPRPTGQSDAAYQAEDCMVSMPPTNSSFDPFYKKYCNPDGIPIIASGAVDDRAMQQAYLIIANMLAPIPKVQETLIDQGAYFIVIGMQEMQTDIPEYAHMDSEFWDQRARGLGGSRRIDHTSAAEENLLCRYNDRYKGESIAVHEFAHTIHLTGLTRSLPGFNRELKRLFRLALSENLWANTYAGKNVEEYWAEGVQSYFNTNMEVSRPDGVHNAINTRDELEQYDPRLYALIDQVFDSTAWYYKCPHDRY